MASVINVVINAVILVVISIYYSNNKMSSFVIEFFRLILIPITEKTSRDAE